MDPMDTDTDDAPPPPPALTREWSVDTRSSFGEFSKKNDSPEARAKASCLLTEAATKPPAEKERIKQIVRQGSLSQMGKLLFRSASSGDDEVALPLTLTVVGKWKGEITVSQSSTVQELRKSVASSSGIDQNGLKLIFKGVSLDSLSSTIEQAGLKHKNKIMVVESVVAAPAPAPAPTPAPTLCAASCGFYAAPGRNLCSVCFKKSPSAMQCVPVARASALAPSPSPAPAPAPGPGPGPAAAWTQKKAIACNKKGKCAMKGCKKKLGFLPPCKCGLNFCSIHRHAEAHSCAFDWKGSAKQSIAQQNPAIAFSKLNRI